MQTVAGLAVFLVLVVLGLQGLQAGGSVPQAVIVMLSAAVGFAVWRAQENAKQTRELEQKVGTDKNALYKLYTDVLREIIEKSGQLDDSQQQAYVKRLRVFAFNSLLIASDDVVLAHDRFLNAGTIGQQMIMPAIADVVLAMRRDLGQPTSGLKAIDVLATFIKAEDVRGFEPTCEEWDRQKSRAWPLTRPPRSSPVPRQASEG